MTAAEDMFRCKSCDKSFKTQFSLNMHLKKNCGQMVEPATENESESLTCIVCQRAFPSTQALIQHVSTHVPALDDVDSAAETLDCTICAEKYDTPEALYRHVWTHVIKIERESDCLKPKNDAEDAVNGSNDEDAVTGSNDDDAVTGSNDEDAVNGPDDDGAVSGDEEEDPEDADDRPRGKAQLARTHSPRPEATKDGAGTGTGALSCRHCGKTYYKKGALHMHENAHELHPCNLCDKILHGKQGLKLHRTRIHGAANALGTAPAAPVAKTPVHSQPKRSLSSSKDGPFKCSECLKLFKNQAWLTRHKPQCNPQQSSEKTAVSKAEKRVPKAEAAAALAGSKKNLQCLRCVKEKPHSAPGDTKMWWRCPHRLRSSPGERPFKCTFCSWAFKSVSHLKDHLFSHIGIKPFQCPACKKKFSKKRGLVSHSKICH